MVLQREQLMQGILITVVLSTAAMVGLAAPGRAQRVVPKRQTDCPMGYVDTARGTCSTLGVKTYTVQPAQREVCPSGWVNVGGGYCRKE